MLVARWNQSASADSTNPLFVFPKYAAVWDIATQIAGESLSTSRCFPRGGRPRRRFFFCSATSIQKRVRLVDNYRN
jgi:hypothetical protein